MPLGVVYFEVVFGPGRKGRGNRGLAEYMEEKGGCIARIAGVGDNRERWKVKVQRSSARKTYSRPRGGSLWKGTGAR